MNQETIEAQYQGFVNQQLNLDLTRGKPCAEQLDLSNDLLSLDSMHLAQDGTDVRNYGGLKGIPEARALGSWLLDAPAENVIAGGNSSLNLMYLVLAWRMKQLQAEGARKDPFTFICLVPGYDRHFTLCEHLGIKMIAVPLLDSGPDMAAIENLVREDASICGIWCVPKYSNPTGHTYSDDAVRRIAALPKLTPTPFLVMWDNAYAVHHLKDQEDRLANLFTLSGNEGTQDNVAIFGSTSKITFAGAGVGFCGLSDANLLSFDQFMGEQMIGFDKLNQLKHAQFLSSPEKLASHMAAHRRILEPKFAEVYAALTPLAAEGLVQFTAPAGGYFVSVDLKRASAQAVVRLAAEAGVKLTPAGATYPYGQDPLDANLRIAPSFPKTEVLKQAMEVFACCVRLASLD